MRDIQISQQTIQNQRPSTQKKLVNYLRFIPKSELDSSDLTLTKLGRKLETNTKVKHAIKRVIDCLKIANYIVKKTLFINGMPT
ncbi:hypothetical protein AB4210_014830 [Vibrio cyclitrophicus]|uniref:hypothetical protein n=1 Tax=Vibrio cyclitrophicus TaxID=47951 RepID=UPI0002DAFC3A|nr:hypothetical protein [Vibrio cyclitrophicus]